METLRKNLHAQVEQKMPDYIRILEEERVVLGTDDQNLSRELIDMGYFEPNPSVKGNVAYYKLTEKGVWFKENCFAVSIPSELLKYFNTQPSNL